MPVTYDCVVPWGRSFDEYVRMFGLTEHDLTRKILGCGDGPASFNKTMRERGNSVVSIDPIYQFSAAQIRERIDATYQQVMEQTRQNADKFLWTTIPSLEALGRIRMSAMLEFLDDYETGTAEGRYRFEELPSLSFADSAFDLALCSHFLFLYSDNLSEEFHREAIAEMLRVAREVRIFPILDLNANLSRYVEPMIAYFSACGFQVKILDVDYEFQRGGNKMMKLQGYV
ncbi:hypothetical protein U14_00859 [Candidatus Moduliflexus flocculans]|uniref:SAM-dependent methyltransferase n=1 Tax=Candidatus Moduliflexus flocculans TaxID=1499966 RepID=A0A0S6VUE5_9BACT|nr:hypothetical protein U14_00859 [Candidatus Moduliflexus flocculans]